MAKTVKIVVDTHRLKRKLNDIWEQGELATRPAAQAGAQVFYDAAKARAPEFESVFIDGDDALEARYGLRVPVLRDDARDIELDWPFDAEKLRGFLAP